eukprot:1947619-Amphidinium_carterae.1
MKCQQPFPASTAHRRSSLPEPPPSPSRTRCMLSGLHQQSRSPKERVVGASCKASLAVSVDASLNKRPPLPMKLPALQGLSAYMQHLVQPRGQIA